MQLARLLASIPSFFGASYIIQHVLRCKKRQQRAMTRILFSMSCVDLIFAMTSVFSSSITPQEVRVPYPTLSIGTWTTCQVFGFLGHGAILSFIFIQWQLVALLLLDDPTRMDRLAHSQVQDVYRAAIACHSIAPWMGHCHCRTAIEFVQSHLCGLRYV
jgi:hypothetical protein